MANTILSPDGRQWRVRRRIVPRIGAETMLGRMRRRLKAGASRAGNSLDVGDGCLSIDIGDIAVVVIVVVALLALAFIVVPLLAAIVDLLILVLLALFGTLARIVLRRPWVVEASASDGENRQWRVVGWRRSGRQRDEIAQLLASGVTPPDDRLTF